MDNLARIPTSANIPHRDISAIWGNPYIGVVTKWNELPWQRKQNILEDYPDTDRIAGRINEAKQALTLDLAVADYTAREFINDMVLVTSAIALDFICPPASAYTTPVVATSSMRVMARLAPKLGTVAAELGLEAQRLYKKADNFFKKKASESAKPRLGTSGFKEGKYWSGLNPVNTPAANSQIGKINKQAFGGGEIRTDGTYVYRFDPAHKTGKIHIEMYRKIKDNHWRAYAERDPRTGETIAGSIERLAQKKNIRNIKW